MFLNLVVIIYFNYIFHVNIQLFVTLMSDQDPDPHGSALILFGCASWNRIRIRIEIKSWIRIRNETNADPHHWYFFKTHFKTKYFFELSFSHSYVLFSFALYPKTIFCC
jgi:hypothetical protein